MNRILFRGLALLLVLGCGDDVTPPPITEVHAVALTPERAALIVGDTIRLLASATDVTGRPVQATARWTSSDAAVARVDDGLVLATAPGEVTITAAVGGREARARITVTAPQAPPGRLTVSPADWRLEPGQSVRFEAAPDRGDARVVWLVDGVVGGNASLGRITTEGVYTAPRVPTSVRIRAESVADRTVVAESPVEVVFPDGQELRIRWASWEPRVIDPSATDSATLTVWMQGYPSSAALVRAGTTAALRPVRSETYEIRLSRAEVLHAYAAGGLHAVVGAIDLTKGGPPRRFNLGVNVRPASAGDVAVSRLADDVQASPYVVNIRYDSLYLGSQVPQEVVRSFYRHFPDDYDFLAVVEQGAAYRNRFYAGVRNPIRGLGMPIYDRGAEYGSAARLQGILHYPLDSYFDLADRTTSHEIGHRWMAFSSHPLLASARAHWPMSTLAYGIMGISLPGSGAGGTFSYRIVEQPDGTFQFASAPPPDVFNDFELYMMGLLPADSVGVQRVVEEQTQTVASGATIRGAVSPLTVQDLIALEGPREPSAAESQRRFRLATIVLSRGRLLTPAEMAYFDHLAARGEAREELLVDIGLATGFRKPFWLATGGRAELVTRLR